MNTENTTAQATSDMIVTIGTIQLNMTALQHAATLIAKTDETLATAAKAFLTPELVADKAARKFTQDAWGRYMVSERGASVDYARTSFYRILKYAGFKADGTAIGAENDEKQAADEAVSSVDTSREAWNAAYPTDAASLKVAEGIMRAIRAELRAVKQSK
jgi:hypothetical protein